MVTSAGLGDLVRVTAQANSQGGRVVLANLTPFVSGVLDTTRLSAFFEISANVDSAIAKLA
jgi:anti-anti-sigma factor